MRYEGTDCALMCSGTGSDVSIKRVCINDVIFRKFVNFVHVCFATNVLGGGGQFNGQFSLDVY